MDDLIRIPVFNYTLENGGGYSSGLASMSGDEYGNGYYNKLEIPCGGTDGSYKNY